METNGIMNYKSYVVCIELNTKAAVERFENMRSAVVNNNLLKIMDNVYILQTSYMVTSSQLRDSIISYMGSQNFNLFIMKSSIDASWRISSNIDMRLKELV